MSPSLRESNFGETEKTSNLRWTTIRRSVRSATMHEPSSGLPEKCILLHFTDLRLLASNHQPGVQSRRLIKFSNHNLIAFNYFWIALPPDSVKYYVEQTIYSIPICRLIWIGILSSSSNIINCYFPEVSNLITAAISLAVLLWEQKLGRIANCVAFCCSSEDEARFCEFCVAAETLETCVIRMDLKLEVTLRARCWFSSEDCGGCTGATHRIGRLMLKQSRVLWCKP